MQTILEGVTGGRRRTWSRRHVRSVGLQEARMSPVISRTDLASTRPKRGSGQESRSARLTSVTLKTRGWKRQSFIGRLVGAATRSDDWLGTRRNEHSEHPGSYGYAAVKRHAQHEEIKRFHAKVQAKIKESQDGIGEGE